MFSFALFLLVIGNAHAEQAVSLADLVLKSGSVKTLVHSIHTYNYATREDAGVPTQGPLSLTDPKIAGHVTNASHGFQDLSQKPGHGMVGGLYLASDPVVSRAFGGEHWLLYRVELRAGMKYLDLKALDTSATEDIPAEGVARLKSSGCDLSLELNNRWTDFFYKSFDLSCRKAALETLAELGVDFIAYSWMSTELPPCMNRPDDAFILLKPESLGPDAVRVFYADSPHSGPELLEEALLETAFHHIQLGSGGYTAPQKQPELYEPWPELDPKLASDSDFLSYLTDHIYSGQP